MLRLENYIKIHLSEQHIQLQQLLRCYGQINQEVMNPQSQLLVLMCTIVLIHLPKKMDGSIMMMSPLTLIILILEGTHFLIICKGLLNSVALEILWSLFSAKAYFHA
ncbi:hypothetical protein V8G54_028949 [Vigna mungo]|uniref:Uncharacterized protein n=1 Tax=Vigna mungo TaxID=3915 RepID=A0AAQ3RIN3_VIGMU